MTYQEFADAAAYERVKASAAESNAAARAAGWFANSTARTEQARASGAIGNANRPRPRPKEMAVLRLISEGVVTVDAIRAAIRATKSMSCTRDLLAKGEIIRTSPGVYALTDLGRAALEGAE